MMEIFKKCPLSVKNAPIVDYKNISLLKNIFQIMEKLFLLKLHLFHLVNKKNLLREIKKAKILGLYKWK